MVVNIPLLNVSVLIATIVALSGLFLLQLDNALIGIAAEDIPNAFERFRQIDNSLSRKYEGAGLGLPLARDLVELHGGRFILDSVLQVGTTVTIVLPEWRLGAAQIAGDSPGTQAAPSSLLVPAAKRAPTRATAAAPRMGERSSSTDPSRPFRRIACARRASARRTRSASLMRIHHSVAARASPRPKIPRPKRGCIYETEYLVVDGVRRDIAL